MKLNKAIRLSLVCAAAAVSMVITGCYMMPGSGNGTAKVAVAVGAKGIPANLTSVALVVTAPGMATISTTASVTAGSITVSVPAGPSRTFTLLLNGPSATLEGVATVDLQPGETTTVNVTPTLGATQLVIPDAVNFQIVQIGDMTGAGWTAISASNFGVVTGGALTPYAIDFDNLGRIYIANNFGTPTGLLRIDDINHASTYSVVDATSGIKAVAIDRVNGLVYYNGTNGILMKSVNNIVAAATALAVALIPSSMAVDNQGMLYMIVGTSIIKYNPTTQAVVTASYTLTPPSIFAPVDGIMVKDPYVYVGDAAVGRVVRFNENLQLIDSFGGPSSYPLYGPETFVAAINRKFTLIDEKSGTDRLVSFDDMTGTNWATYGSHGGSGTPGFFDFYSAC